MKLWIQMSRSHGQRLYIKYPCLNQRPILQVKRGVVSLIKIERKYTRIVYNIPYRRARALGLAA